MPLPLVPLLHSGSGTVQWQWQTGLAASESLPQSLHSSHAKPQSAADSLLNNLDNTLSLFKIARRGSWV